LKKYYGTGYTLKLTTTGGENGNKEILDVVQSFIPRAVMDNSNDSNNDNMNHRHSNGSGNGNGNGHNKNNQSEFVMSLPNDEKTLEIFPSLFSKLNTDKESLGIVTIGLSLSTIDQVFLKIGEMEAIENGELLPTSPQNKNDEKSTNGNGMTNGINMNGSNKKDDTPPRRPERKIMHQLYGLFQKKYNFTIRNRKLLISQVNI
jgi:hypothetical protein